MLKMWGRNTSSNVQKAMWAVGELKLPCERIDVGGAFGKTKEPFYLAMNPNSLVPTLEEDDGFTLWESNSVVRYLAGQARRHARAEGRRRCARRRSQWMDWQLSVIGPAITPVFWGLIRTPPEKRDQTAIDAGKEKTTAAAKIMDAQLGKTRFMAGDAFSYGDIPVGVMIRRYMELVPERPKMANLERWFGEIPRAPAVQGALRRHSADVSRMIRAKEGRILGLVGGLGPGATVYYYNGLLAAHKAQGRVARMLIAHADVDHGRPLAEAEQARRACALSQRLHRRDGRGRRRDGGDRRGHAAHLHRRSSCRCCAFR